MSTYNAPHSHQPQTPCYNWARLFQILAGFGVFDQMSDICTQIVSYQQLNNMLLNLCVLSNI